MEFEWHPDKAAQNIANHDVTFNTASRVFLDPFHFEISNSHYDILQTENRAKAHLPFGHPTLKKERNDKRTVNQNFHCVMRAPAAPVATLPKGRGPPIEISQAVAFSPWGEGGRPARMRKQGGAG